MDRYLNTLRLVPDEIILAAATHAIEVGSITTCLVGALSVEAQQAYGLPQGWEPRSFSWERWPSWADNADGMIQAPYDVCQAILGGTVQEWVDLFGDAAGEHSGKAVEEAFVVRVAEAAERTKLPRRRTVTA